MIPGTNPAIKSHSRGLGSSWNKLTEMMWKLNCCSTTIQQQQQLLLLSGSLFGRARRQHLRNLRQHGAVPSLRDHFDVQASLTSSPKANTCYTAGATQVREGDKLFLRDVEPMHYSVMQSSKTFF